MGQRYSREQWAEWIIEQAESELTISEFCDSIGVSENSFYVWRRKLRAKAAVALSPGSASPDGFVQLAIAEPATAHRVEIELPCGAVVRVPGDDSSIRQVLGVLLEAGAADAGGSSC